MDEAFPVAVDEAFPVAADEAVPVEAGEEAFPERSAVVAGEAAAVPVWVLVDAGDGE